MYLFTCAPLLRGLDGWRGAACRCGHRLWGKRAACPRARARSSDAVHNTQQCVTVHATQDLRRVSRSAQGVVSRLRKGSAQGCEVGEADTFGRPQRQNTSLSLHQLRQLLRVRAASLRSRGRRPQEGQTPRTLAAHCSPHRPSCASQPTLRQRTVCREHSGCSCVNEQLQAPPRPGGLRELRACSLQGACDNLCCSAACNSVRQDELYAGFVCGVNLLLRSPPQRGVPKSFARTQDLEAAAMAFVKRRASTRPPVLAHPPPPRCAPCRRLGTGR